MQGSPFGIVSLEVDEPEGDPQRGPGTINSPKTHLHVSPYPEQHVSSYADTTPTSDPREDTGPDHADVSTTRSLPAT